MPCSYVRAVPTWLLFLGCARRHHPWWWWQTLSMRGHPRQLNCKVFFGAGSRLGQPCWLLVTFSSEPVVAHSRRGTKFYWQLNPMLMPTQLAESTGSRPAHAALAWKLLWLLEAIPHTHVQAPFFGNPEVASNLLQIAHGKSALVDTYWPEEFHYSCAEMLQPSSFYTCSMMFMCFQSQTIKWAVQIYPFDAFWPWALWCLSTTCQAHLFLWHLRRRSKFRGRSCAMAGCRGVSWFRTSGWRRPSFRRSNVGVSDTVTIYFVQGWWRLFFDMSVTTCFSTRQVSYQTSFTLAFCGLDDIGLADAGFTFQGILHADRNIQKRVWPREANNSAKYNMHQAWCEWEHAVKKIQENIFSSAFSTTAALCLCTQQRYWIQIAQCHVPLLHTPPTT